MASYLLALVTLEMGLTVDFGHRFKIKFERYGIFKSGLEVLEIRHSELELEREF